MKVTAVREQRVHVLWNQHPVHLVEHAVTSDDVSLKNTNISVQLESSLKRFNKTCVSIQCEHFQIAGNQESPTGMKSFCNNYFLH